MKKETEPSGVVVTVECPCCHQKIVVADEVARKKMSRVEIIEEAATVADKINN